MPSRRVGRRSFLKTAGAFTAGAVLAPRAAARSAEHTAAASSLAVRPFALTQVSLGEGIFRQKRDRILHFARFYGGEEERAGPDRLLSNFRANARLDVRGAQPPGSWDNATGYLRGHYTGHFMSMLAQAYAGTGDALYKRKLDYIVAGLAECQDALAAAARKPTPRTPGRFGNAVRLTGSPIGHAEHVALPAGLVDGFTDFTMRRGSTCQCTTVRVFLIGFAIAGHDRRRPVKRIGGIVEPLLRREKPTHVADGLPRRLDDSVVNRLHGTIVIGRTQARAAPSLPAQSVRGPSVPPLVTG
jgi:beta-L-arabinofuranosidase (glycosyl hydrolase family 127)